MFSRNKTQPYSKTCFTNLELARKAWKPMKWCWNLILSISDLAFCDDLWEASLLSPLQSTLSNASAAGVEWWWSPQRVFRDHDHLLQNVNHESLALLGIQLREAQHYRQHLPIPTTYAASAIDEAAVSVIATPGHVNIETSILNHALGQKWKGLKKGIAWLLAFWHRTHLAYGGMHHVLYSKGGLSCEK